jgi:hypothetical protein
MPCDGIPRGRRAHDRAPTLPEGKARDDNASGIGGSGANGEGAGAARVPITSTSPTAKNGACPAHFRQVDNAPLAGSGGPCRTPPVPGNF